MNRVPSRIKQSLLLYLCDQDLRLRWERHKTAALLSCGHRRGHSHLESHLNRSRFHVECGIQSSRTTGPAAFSRERSNHELGFFYKYGDILKFKYYWCSRCVFQASCLHLTLSRQVLSQSCTHHRIYPGILSNFLYFRSFKNFIMFLLLYVSFSSFYLF